MSGKIIFISSIDTDTGKTIFTSLLGRYLKKKGYSVITQKIIQTGCENFSEDIKFHRKIMNEQLNHFDLKGLTCPYIFKYPASPHLAAMLEGKTIDLNFISYTTERLAVLFNYVLVEGAGGLYVPLTNDVCLIDYIQEKKYPVVLVTSSKLGSINHTLLSIELAWRRGINVSALVYNNYPITDEVIFNDSIKVFRKYMNKYFPASGIVNLPVTDFSENTEEVELYLSTCLKKIFVTI
ncbi:MAG: ATP-dependent dethiobiotin synthetase BioD [Bacteroidia bacterium]|nr:ATP-dependent dethiobiotin synthetase BioD [Bacteroidia bacterium]